MTDNYDLRQVTNGAAMALAAVAAVTDTGQRAGRRGCSSKRTERAA